MYSSRIFCKQFKFLKMKIFWLSLLFYLPVCAQQTIEVKYLIRYNDNLKVERSDRMHDGILRIAGDKSFFFMDAHDVEKSDDQLNASIVMDTTFLVAVDQSKNELYAVDFLFGKGFLWVKDSLHPMKWSIDTLSKKIGELNCIQAKCQFRGRNYIAWFTPDIPIPFGPWKMGGLPGLIVELEDDNQNIVVKFQKISSTQEKVKMPIPKMDWLQFIKVRKKYFDEFAASIRAEIKSDCISCKTEARVSMSETLEKY